jgi:hypothetical protein
VPRGLDASSSVRKNLTARRHLGKAAHGPQTGRTIIMSLDTVKTTVTSLADDGSNYRAWRTSSRLALASLGKADVFTKPPPGALFMTYERWGRAAPVSLAEPVLLKGGVATVIEASTQLGLEADEFTSAKTWAADQYICFAKLMLWLGPVNQADLVESSITVNEVYAKLDLKYGISLTQTGVLALRELVSASYDADEPIVDYFGRTTEARRRLAEAGFPLADSLVAMLVLVQMPASMAHVVQVLYSVPATELTLDLVTRRLTAATVVADEQRRLDGLALSAKGKGRTPFGAKRTSTSDGASGGKKGLCDRHPTLRHTNAECYEQHPELKAAYERGKAANARVARVKSPEGAASSLAQCSSPVRSALSAVVEDDLLVAKASRVSSRRASGKPRLDSGADRHFFHDLRAFISYAVFSPPRKIEVATGSMATALGHGTVVLRSPVTGQTVEL